MWPPSGLGLGSPQQGQGMLNLSGTVRLGKVYFSSNQKDCQNVKVFSQGPLKLTCARHTYIYSMIKLTKIYLLYIQNSSHFASMQKIPFKMCSKFIFQWYVNCINLVVNLILPTMVLGILNYFVYKVLNRNQVATFKINVLHN